MIEFKILDKTPIHAKDKTHYYCDYIELVALCGDENGISNSDIYDRFHEDDKISSIGSEDGAESNEAWVGEIDIWLQELKSREICYDDKYPFSFEDGRFKIQQNLTDHQLVYLGLLLCSSLRYIEQSHIFSSAFERASLYAMKEYLPQIAEVHTFGVSSPSVRYSGSLEVKMRLLSSDLNYPVSSRPNVFRQRDNGDAGIDIIAWLPFNLDSNLDKKLLFVGQSASTTDWSQKQASVDRLKSYLDIECSFLNVLFVPYDMRDIDRNIQEWTLVTTDILFDRHRLLQLLKPEAIFSAQTGAEFKSLIESAVIFVEDIL
jgi:hypothetical protein